MPRLFIANATKQVHSFHYRLRGSSGVRNQTIPIGGQVEISGKLEDDDVNYIIDQHRIYGLFGVDEFDRADRQVLLLFSIDKPVRPGAILEADKLNTIFLLRRGKRIREDAALAESRILQQQLEEAGRQERLRQLETSIVEEEPNPASATPQVAEGYRVTPQVQDDTASAPRRSRRKAQ